MTLQLYFAPGSSSLAPLVALEELDIPYVGHRLDLAAGDQRKPEYLKVNPRGRVPTLVVDGQPVTEVLAILTYLAHRYPHSELLPLADPLKLAKAYEVMSWFASTVHVAFAQIARPERYADDEATKAALATPGEARFARTLADIERLAQGPGPWLLGDGFSVVDAYALVIWRWAERRSIDTALYPAWSAKAARAFARPSVVRALRKEAAPVTA
ncbi:MULTISPECIES: glutathione S-transferase family protein [Caulobacter]|jgi:glutathione S-transferase|uniref:Glutathione S-transferase n=1 Tax=Caulobacter vibrioides OR37 TaxID=1292034 RepID=R0ESU2_CAUVI|nr:MULTISPECIES: glutathione S-transferase family protein [Caulobacter]ENZ84037.1 glutathione S-transferase [Caulobacter vibrioides OR37]MBQ1561785.1 glutathione S-transferase family protein [Caulobacter sp.]